MKKLLLISILVFSFIPCSGYSATENPPQVPPTNTIHIDSVSIKTSDDSAGASLSEEDKKRLIYDVGESAKDHAIDWAYKEFLWFGIISLFGLMGMGYAFIQVAIDKQVSKHIDKLDDARAEAIAATSQATTEIEKTRDALLELQRLESDFKGQMLLRSKEIELLGEKTAEFRVSFTSSYEDLRIDVKDDIYYLTMGDDVQTKWLKAIDSGNLGSNKVIDSLISDLNNTNDSVRNKAAEQLSYFNDDEGKIFTAFAQLLQSESETPFGATLLSKIGKLGKNDEAFEILSDLLIDLDTPNIAAVIGALGNLQENREDKPDFISKIVDKLIEILEKLNAKITIPGTVEASEIANKKNAVAIALTYSEGMGEKAIPLLINLVDDTTDNEYRKSAAIALGNIGKKDTLVIAVLKKLSKDTLPQLSSAAEDALRNINEPTIN